ncbi:HET-domain-containing protein [Hirsutella rhossiliensis]
MLFRNPFRFGKSLPWKPAGESKPIWNIDKELNVLSLHGFVIGSIRSAETYNESCFGNAMIDSNKGKNELNNLWRRILSTLSSGRPGVPFTASVLAATATSLAFGLDEASDPCAEQILTHNFIAYLKLVLDEETYNKFIPLEVSKKSAQVDGHIFGKPVWDFKYPDSSIFITDGGLVGCCICTTMPGDVVFVAFGSIYPFVLRPSGRHYLLRGYAFVHGAMHGEQCPSKGRVLKIR